MDLSETAINIIIGILIAGLLVFNFFVRKRKTEKTPLGMAVSIFTELRQNQTLVETFSFHWKVGRFKTASWKRNGARIDFVPIEIRTTLSKAFDMLEDFNQRIDAAKSYKSDSYMAAIDVDKLKAPLAESMQQLQVWVQENANNPEYLPKRRGLFG